MTMVFESSGAETLEIPLLILLNSKSLTVESADTRLAKFELMNIANIDKTLRVIFLFINFSSSRLKSVNLSHIESKVQGVTLFLREYAFDCLIKKLISGNITHNSFEMI
jgi:hypothetical protein